MIKKVGGYDHIKEEWDNIKKDIFVISLLTFNYLFLIFGYKKFKIIHKLFNVLNIRPSFNYIKNLIQDYGKGLTADILIYDFLMFILFVSIIKLIYGTIKKEDLLYNFFYEWIIIPSSKIIKNLNILLIGILIGILESIIIFSYPCDRSIKIVFIFLLIIFVFFIFNYFISILEKLPIINIFSNPIKERILGFTLPIIFYILFLKSKYFENQYVIYSFIGILGIMLFKFFLLKIQKNKKIEN